MLDLTALWGLATTFALVLLRIMGVLAVAQPFAAPAVPVSLRALLALLLAFVLVPVVEVWPESGAWGFAAAALAELAIGLAMGFMTLLLFMAVQGAGDLIDKEMGFGLVNVIDPHFGGRSPLMGSFLYIVTILLLLTFDGHHHILQALADSFQRIPLGGGSWQPGALVTIVHQFGWVFMTAVRLSMPVLAAIFILHAIFGIFARAMPQLHVLVVAMPAKVALGLLAVLVSLPVIFRMLSQEWNGIMDGVAGLIRTLAP